MSKSTREAFGEELVLLGEECNNIVTIDADLSSSTKTKDFAKKFPNRALNVGISEQDLVTTATGLVIAGKKVFACTFAAFLTGRAYDQIRTSVAISNIPVCLVGSHAGILTGEDGATHQSLEDIGLMRALENIYVLQPADEFETKFFVREIIKKNLPVYLRLGRAGVENIFSHNTGFEFGKVKKIKDGNDIVIFATGALVHHCLEASKESEKSVKVVNVSCLSPIDEEGILESIKDCKVVITAEDHSIKNGLGSIVSEIMAENTVGKKLHRIGMRKFGESGKPEELYKKYGFDKDGILSILGSV